VGTASIAGTTSTANPRVGARIDFSKVATASKRAKFAARLARLLNTVLGYERVVETGPPLYQAGRRDPLGKGTLR
jgi:hypothetical protein